MNTDNVNRGANLAENLTAPIHETNSAATTRQAAPLDEPPPAYEANPTTINNANPIGNEATNMASENIEAPPPYCLVDPTKVHNMDHLPRYTHISPLEIIDVNTGAHIGNDHSSAQHPVQANVSNWLTSDSNMDVGTDCTFLMAFVIAFFFNWLGFLAVVCLIPTIAARFGAMSGFGLSVAKWITVMRYHEFNNFSNGTHGNMSSGYSRAPHDPAQTFVFAIVLFAGFFLFVRGLVSYIAVKNRANQQGHVSDVFTWY